MAEINLSAPLSRAPLQVPAPSTPAQAVAEGPQEASPSKTKFPRPVLSPRAKRGLGITILGLGITGAGFGLRAASHPGRVPGHLYYNFKEDAFKYSGIIIMVTGFITLVAGASVITTAALEGGFTTRRGQKISARPQFDPNFMGLKAAVEF